MTIIHFLSVVMFCLLNVRVIIMTFTVIVLPRTIIVGNSSVHGLQVRMPKGLLFPQPSILVIVKALQLLRAFPARRWMANSQCTPFAVGGGGEISLKLPLCLGSTAAGRWKGRKTYAISVS